MNEREAPSQADVERARAWLRGAFSRFPAHVWLPQVESLAAQFAAVAAEHGRPSGMGSSTPRTA